MKSVLVKLFFLTTTFLLLSVNHYFGSLKDIDLRVKAAHPPTVCACNNCSFVCDGLCSGDVFCSDTCGVPCDIAYNIYIGACCDTGTGSGCVALTCENIALGGCADGTGSIDNCGGVSCNSCDGSTGGPTPTPNPGDPPGCYNDCSAEPCKATTCNNLTCLGDCSTYCYGSVAPTVPTAPILQLANGASVNPGNINLSWLAGSWGSCPLTKTFQVCVSTNAADPCAGGINLSNIPEAQLSYTYSQSTPGTYYWRVGANNGTGLATVFSEIRSFVVNTAPTLNSVSPLLNSAGTSVAWEAGNVAHICKTQFVDAALPRRVTFVFTLSDLDGWTNIQSARMRWNGNVYNLTITGGSGNLATASVTLNFTGTDNGITTQPVEVQISDLSVTTAYIDSGYDWKVWDCNVSVSGTMYDSSSSLLGAQCPSGVGFSTLAGAAMNFNYADFTPTIGTLVRVNATNDSAYSGGVLSWGKTYTAAPNSDLVGGSIISRWINLGVGTTSCGTQNTINSTIADPYAATQSLRVDFASAAAQSAWFQVAGGGIQAVGTVEGMVPITCGLDATCVGAMAKTNNTMISGSSISNGGCVLGSANCQYGNPNNWYRNASTLSSIDKYDYRYFYDKYFIGYGGGSTLPANATMTNVKSAGGTGVFFINGDFNINENNLVPVGQSLFIIVKGDITFDPIVTQSQGIFVADGGMTASGSSANALLIEGSLYSSGSIGDILLSRTFTNPVNNNNQPAVLVTYRPDMVFNLPGAFLKVLSGWRQN